MPTFDRSRHFRGELYLHLVQYAVEQFEEYGSFPRCSWCDALISPKKSKRALKMVQEFIVILHQINMKNPKHVTGNSADMIKIQFETKNVKNKRFHIPLKNTNYFYRKSKLQNQEAI